MKTGGWYQKAVSDSIVLAIISGVAGTLVMYAVGLPLYLLKATKVIYLLYTVEFFVTPEIARTTGGLVAGFVTGLMAGAALAVGFKLLIEWKGAELLWVKAITYAALMWFVWVGLARYLLDITPYLSQDLRSNMLLLLLSLIYQIATTYFMVKLAGGREALERP